MSHCFRLLLVSGLLALSLGCQVSGQRPEKDKRYLGRPLNEVVAGLDSNDPKKRVEAARTLSYGPTKEAVPALCRALKDTEAEVAEHAAKGLGYVGPEAHPAVPILIKRIGKPPSEKFRQAALDTLGQIGPKAVKAVPAIIEQLRNQKVLVQTRQRAVLALDKLGPVARAAVPALTESLAEHELEPLAVAALIRMGQAARPAVPALSKRLQPEKPYWLDLVRFLVEVNPAAARPAIPDLRALASSEPVRNKGIVNFRDSQRRIAEAKKLLTVLESPESK